MKLDIAKLKANKAFRIISITIIALIAMYIIYFIYKYIQKKRRAAPFLIKKKVRADYNSQKNKYSKKTTKRSSYKFVNDKKLKKSYNGGHDYTYSFWINVEDWDYKFGQPKHVFHKGDRKAESVNPGVWLYPKKNALMIRIDTYGRKNNVDKTKSGKDCQYWDSQYPHIHKYTESNYRDKDLGNHNYCRNPDDSPTPWCLTTDNDIIREDCDIVDHNIAASMNPNDNTKVRFDVLENCDIINIPIQRWTHIALVLHNRTLDVFLNGKLARSCTYKYVPKINKGNVHITDNGGFKGELSELRYFNRTLSPTEIYNIYRRGYSTFSLYDKIASITPKIEVDFSASVNSDAYNS